MTHISDNRATEALQNALDAGELDLDAYKGHTPGEWYVEFDRHKIWPQRIKVAGGPYHPEYSLIAQHANNALATRCSSGPIYTTYVEESANFNLMADAPRILAELKRTRAERDALRAHAEHAIEQADAALAKLTGDLPKLEEISQSIARCDTALDKIIEQRDTARTALAGLVEAAERLTDMLDIDTEGDACKSCGGSGWPGGYEAGAPSTCGYCNGSGCEYGFIDEAIAAAREALK